MLNINDLQYTKDFLNKIFYSLEGDEYIRICKLPNKREEENPNKFTIPLIKKYNSIDDIIDGLEDDFNKKSIYFKERYFQLQTVKGIDGNGTKSSRNYQYCIGFDIDLCDNTTYTKEEIHSFRETNDKRYKEEMHKLLQKILKVTKEVGFYSHYILSSGFGFQIFQLIQKTNDFEKVEETTKAIYNLLVDKGLKVDDKALSPTQLLRIPYTFNNKVAKNKPFVNVVINNINGINKDGVINKQNDNFHRKSINSLYNTFVKAKIKDTSYQRIDCMATLKVVEGKCGKNELLEQLIINGSGEDRKRTYDFVNIIVYLRFKKVEYDCIVDIIKNWASKSNYDKATTENIDYVYYKQHNYVGLTKEEEKEFLSIGGSYSYSDFNFEDDKAQYGLIEVNQKLGNRNKEGMIMNENELFIYNVLAHKRNIPLTVNDILYLITDENQIPIIKERTVKKALDGLIEKGFVEKVGKKYNINESSKTKYLTFSYFINLAVIWHKITLKEMRFYVYLRAKQQQKVDEGKVKGNELKYISMDEMAKDIGIKDRKWIEGVLKKFVALHIIDRMKVQLKDENNRYKYTYDYYLNK